MTKESLNNQTGEIPADTSDSSGSQLEKAIKASFGFEPGAGGPETSSAGVSEHSLDIKVGTTVYHCVFNDDQWVRLQSLIPPKPVPSDLDRAQVTADHIDAVINCWQLLLNRANETIKDHDSRKLQQTEDEHHTEEAHHWPLDGYDTADGYLPLQYVAEAVCDYLATMFGRAFAGREFGYLPPTNQITAADVLGATCVDIFVAYELATVTPAPPLPRRTRNEERDRDTFTGDKVH